jgi:hypothetical protein
MTTIRLSGPQVTQLVDLLAALALAAGLALRHLPAGTGARAQDAAAGRAHVQRQGPQDCGNHR